MVSILLTIKTPITASEALSGTPSLKKKLDENAFSPSIVGSFVPFLHGPPDEIAVRLVDCRFVLRGGRGLRFGKTGSGGGEKRPRPALLFGAAAV